MPPTPSINPQDPLNIDSLLTEDERAVQNATREFVQSELMPIITEANRTGQFPREVATKMGEMGLLGVTIPHSYGGAGMSYMQYGLINREVEYCDSAFRSFMSVQSSLVMHPIYQFGSDAQKEKYLPKLAAGELIGCFGLTEPDGGSDPNDMRTIAKEADGGYTLSGEKTWITNSPIADVFIVWGKLNNEVRGFILEKDMAGLSAPKIEGKMSLLASDTGMIVMEDVFVPPENLLPNVTGLKGPFSCLNSARYGISWGAMGAAQFCFDTALNYTNERDLFGKPLSGQQLVQKKLADMSTHITTGTLLSLQLGRLKDAGTDNHNQTSYAKRNNVGTALDIARTARDMLGGNGVSDEYGIIRHLMNLESVVTYEGTADIHALIIGRALTGQQAFG